MLKHALGSESSVRSQSIVALYSLYNLHKTPPRPKFVRFETVSADQFVSRNRVLQETGSSFILECSRDFEFRVRLNRKTFGARRRRQRGERVRVVRRGGRGLRHRGSVCPVTARRPVLPLFAHLSTAFG